MSSRMIVLRPTTVLFVAIGFATLLALQVETIATSPLVEVRPFIWFMRLALLGVDIFILGWALRSLLRTFRVQIGTDPPRLVAPNVYQSGALHEEDTYDSLGVDIIFDLSYEPKYVPVVPIGKIYSRWPIKDRELPDEGELHAIARTLAVFSLSHRVLIKCDFGVNRSGLIVSLVIGYQKELMTESIDAQSRRVWNEQFKTVIDDLNQPILVETGVGIKRGL